MDPTARRDGILPSLDGGLNNLSAISGNVKAGAGLVLASQNLFNCLDESISDPFRPATALTQEGQDPQFGVNDQNSASALTFSASSKSQGKRRRVITSGLKPKIVIFSEKKDLIRVSLDSEDDSDVDFKAYPTKYHRFKSARRKSIAGESVNFSSSAESLCGDTDVEAEIPPRVEVIAAAAASASTSTVGRRGVDNFAFENDKGQSASSTMHTQSAGADSKEKPPNDGQSSGKKGRPKSAKKSSGPKTAAAPPLGEITENAEEAVAAIAATTAVTDAGQKRSRAKSAQNQDRIRTKAMVMDRAKEAKVARPHPTKENLDISQRSQETPM